MHDIVPEADAVLEKEFKVLDKGFVRLIDYVGSDQRVVQSARISYGQSLKDSDRDAKLIHYLMKHGHMSPFEQVSLVFHVKMPIFVARQMIRHRTAKVNEISGRYTEMKDEFYVPEPSRMKLQDQKNKQGSGSELVDDPDDLVNALMDQQISMFEEYKGLLDEGLAKEVARINLPLSIYTQWYWKIDLRNLFNFLRQRLDSHAQWEMQQYAETIALLTKLVVPVCYTAFEEFVLDAKVISKSDMKMLRNKVDQLYDTPLSDTARVVLADVKRILF